MGKGGNRFVICFSLPLLSRRDMLVEMTRDEEDDFRRRLKDEWKRLWRERFDDKVRAEGVASQDYPLVFTDRGQVIFATREAKAPSFSDIIEYWRAHGRVCLPDPSVGGWGKFIRTELKELVHNRARMFEVDRTKADDTKRQQKKGGRGWLHK
jgi:hypothetical protein